MKDRKQPSGIVSARCMLLILAGSIIVSKMLVTLLLRTLPRLSLLNKALLDSILLSILVSPVIYFFGFRPLLLEMTERKRAEEAL